MAEVLATYSYTLQSDNTYSITCTNRDVCTKAIIPSEYESLPVKSIDNGAFSGCSSLTSVIIPDSVMSINPGAFAYCSSLTSVIIPYSVLSIGEGAFTYCSSLKNIMISNGVVGISFGAFNLCVSLKDIVIPESVTSIGELAFGYTGVQNVSMLSKTPPSCGLDVFGTPINNNVLNIYCYKESIEAYKTATNLKDYANYFIADDLRLHFTNNALAQKKYFASKEELNNSDIESLNTQRAKVQNAPIEDDDVVRLQDLKSYHHPALTSDFFTNLY